MRIWLNIFAGLTIPRDHIQRILPRGIGFPVNIGVRFLYGHLAGTDEQYEYGYGDEIEVCPPGYHRPSDGYINQVSYNGPYPNYKYGDDYVDIDGKVVSELIKGEENIAFSEWRTVFMAKSLAGRNASR